MYKINQMPSKRRRFMRYTRARDRGITLSVILASINCDHFQLHEPIGKGEFGEVMLGIWKKDGKDEKVAVKMLKDSSTAEAMLMKYVMS